VEHQVNRTQACKQYLLQFLVRQPFLQVPSDWLVRQWLKSRLMCIKCSKNILIHYTTDRPITPFVCRKLSFTNKGSYRPRTKWCVEVWTETELFFFLSFLPGEDASRVYVDAWALCYFHSLIITAHTFRRAADHVGGQLRGDKECPFSGVTSSGRIWRKVSESDATVILTWRASKYKIHELHQRYVLKVCSYFWRFQTLLLLFGGYKRDYRLAIPNVIIFWQFQT